MPDDIDLTNLTAQLGFIIQGDAVDDNAGAHVSSAGDVNGDGIDDIIVAATRGQDGGLGAGEVYVIYGTSGDTRGTVDLSDLTPEIGFIIQGDAERDIAGSSVSSGGDVNGDGIDDIIVGALNGDDGGPNAGEAYVIYGKAGSARSTVDLSTLAPEDGFIIQGDATGDKAGRVVSSAGDVNGDGIDDIIVGALAADLGCTAYIVYGTAGMTRGTVDLSDIATENLSAAAAEIGFHIALLRPLGAAGQHISSAGDVNGDGIDDIIVGNHDNNEGGTSSGSAYVVYGKAGNSRGNIYPPFELQPEDGYSIHGYERSGRVGYSLSSAGDVNADGIDDLVIVAYGIGEGGAAYVVYGTTGTNRETMDLSDLGPSDGFVIQVPGAFTLTGWSVSSAGDVNGDGIHDIIVGARYGDDGGENAGEAYVIYGTTGTRGTLDLSDLAPASGFVIQGDQAGDVAGDSVSSGGDVNGDGIDDIVVGARYGDDGGEDAGEAYVIYGAITTEGEILVDDSGGNHVTGGDGSDVIAGLAGADMIDGGLGGDLIIGGFDSDTLNGGIGDDILIGDNNALIAGNDVLTGGIGDDLLEGGGGADTFLFNPQNGSDIIGQIDVDYDAPFNSTVQGADFVSGVDVIALVGFGIDTGAEALSLVTDVNGVATFASESTVITFAGLTADDLSAYDFTFIL